jgi:lipoprotein-releasing system permease protein|tara:strand:+ start:46230 stop:47471 length:1242 start_codon:yes stop_codon:yes gene_type:complete
MNAVLPFIAKRYLRGQRRHRFGGLVGLFSFFALLIGVASLILVLSVMNGFNTELTGRFLEVLPHITVFIEPEMESEGESDFSARLSTHPEVLAVSPTMEDFVLLTHRDRQLAIALTAVDPILDSAVVDMEPAGVLGDWQDFIDQEYGIAIGMQAANALGLDIGDTVRVNFARVRVLPTGLYPISRGFVVTSIFATNSQIDLELAMVRLEDAEPLMRNSSAESGWRIKLENPLLAESAFREYSQDNQYRLVPWQSRLHGLYEAMKMEKIVVGAMLVLVVLVASFSLVASLVMTVAEKRTDIAVLKTMGADSSIIVGIFVFQALVLGFVGIACGALLGTVLALNFSELIRFFESLFGFQVFDPNVFYVSQLPTDWRFSDLLVVCGVSGCIALLTSIVPAIQAARIAPAEAIHSNG